MEWRPFPKQEIALQRPEYEILFGGSRGPGKTETGLVWLTEHLDHPRFRALVIRKNSDDLSDWLDRANRMFSGFGVSIAYKPAILRFPSGAIIRTGHLKDDQAYTKYQGHEYQRILIEELTQIPDEKRYLQLIASCRTTVGDITPQVFCTTNPGGVGHQWVKARFVDPSPPITPFGDTGRRRIYIPATIDDNPELTTKDPHYVKTLDALRETDEELWKAWRLGSWDTFAGQFFKEFRRDLHTCPPFVPKKGLTIVGGMDWGRTAPFAFLLGALQTKEMEGKVYYRLFIFMEVYGTDKNPKEWADIIKTKLRGFDLSTKDIRWIRGDPAMFTKGADNSMSIADQFLREGIRIQPASNDRIGGWSVVHNWLSLAPDNNPYLIIGENCNNTIRTLPSLIHDENRVEDVDTTGEDHTGDSLRYMVKHLKWVDGRVGGVGHTGTRKVGARSVLIDPETGREISIDIDRFAVEKRGDKPYYPR